MKASSNRPQGATTTPTLPSMSTRSAAAARRPKTTVSSTTASTPRSFGRSEPVQHHKQCAANRLGEPYFVLDGLRRRCGLNDGFVVGQRYLTVPLPGSKNVETRPCGDSGQPSGQVLHVPQIRPADLDPCLLYRVLGVVERAKDAERATSRR